ncbi:actin-related protein 2/3 complex subunit 5-like [Schistocerca gregaria]|uniref:actin-related protein 2/3 complex subunit 5-like n=1 Tax=Schistocerca gregaria TaxID=7010 RepID=UPI00211DD984|nr:actin-related protein 2/3 complex subunit 5-like [Schistocerca gregaria]
MSKVSQLTSYLNSGQPQNALSTALSDPPYDASPDEKKSDIDAVINVLVAIKEKQIQESIDKLSTDEMDILTKYIFKGLESGNNSGVLFKWFAALQEKAGLGSIVRYMTDSNRL